MARFLLGRHGRLQPEVCAMRHSTITLAIAGLCFALVSGCRKQDVGVTETTAAGESRAGTTQRPAAPLSEEDREFMTKAAQGNMLEVALGREVARKAKTSEVKAFGERMVTDHSKANDELRRIAERKGVTLPTELDEDHRRELTQLAALDGDKLDKEYAAHMVEEHTDDVEAFREASRNVKDPELRAWAAKTLPILEEHLALAKKMKEKTSR
jgi:putative membrane protein